MKETKFEGVWREYCDYIDKKSAEIRIKFNREPFSSELCPAIEFFKTRGAWL